MRHFSTSWSTNALHIRCGARWYRSHRWDIGAHITSPCAGTLIKTATSKEGLTVSERWQTWSLRLPQRLHHRSSTRTRASFSFTDHFWVVMTCTEPVCTIHCVVAKESTPTSKLHLEVESSGTHHNKDWWPWRQCDSVDLLRGKNR
jgi:hypothetical protein